MELMFYIGEYDLSPVRANRLIDRVASWRVSELPKGFRTDMTMKEINDEVNSVRYKREIIGRDHWKSPDEFFKDGKGDCEDYCVAKYAVLIEILGQDYERMSVLVGEDIDRQIHAMLLVQRDRKGPVFVLDNRTEIIHTIEDLSWFRPFYSVNEEEVWFYS